MPKDLKASTNLQAHDMQYKVAIEMDDKTAVPAVNNMPFIETAETYWNISVFQIINQIMRYIECYRLIEKLYIFLHISILA